MRSHNQSGSVASMVTIFGLALALVASLGFGFWAFGQSKNYKDNYQQKSSADVSAALAAQNIELLKQYTEQSKKPYKQFNGPATYGSISFNYPLNWSVYVDQTNTSTPVNAYFYPDQVPSVNSGTPFALRIELVTTSYSEVVKRMDGVLKQGTVTAVAFKPESLKNNSNVQPGTRFDGLIADKINGSLVAIQERDKTLVVSTQSTDFKDDFNNIVLPSITFSP